jgi:hypothetical protein
MTPLDDTLRLVASWRFYRRMNDPRDVQRIADFALVIRSRVRKPHDNNT